MVSHPRLHKSLYNLLKPRTHSAVPLPILKMCIGLPSWVTILCNLMLGGSSSTHVGTNAYHFVPGTTHEVLGPGRDYPAGPTPRCDQLEI